MIQIYYDKEKTKEIEQKIWDAYGNREKEWAKTGYNVSECTGCELKCYCNRTGIEQKITKKSIGFLVFGIVSENITMAIYPENERQYKANLAEIIFGHLDVFEDMKYPIEGKATAKRIFKREHLPPIWVTQLINYLTMTGAKKGWLLILDIFTRSFSAWCVEMGEEERLMQIEVLMDKATRFDKAITTQNPSELKINPEEHELCYYKHECPKAAECRMEYRKLQKIKDERKKAKKRRG